MLRKRIILILAVLIVLLGVASPVYAQDYSFQVTVEEVDLYINEDGTVTVTYLYTFVNNPGAHEIDYVDVGVPTRSYSLNGVTASVDGNPVTDIERSPYVDPGIAIGLGRYAIPPGGQGTVEVTIPGIEDMLYKTNQVEGVEEEYTSFQFSPNSFSPEYVTGTTAVTVALHLPPGLTTEDARYFTPQRWHGDNEPYSEIDDNGRVTYWWYAEQATVDTQYVFGAAFPQRLVPASALVTEPVFDTGGRSFGEVVCPWAFCLGFGGFIVLIIWASYQSNKKRKLAYLPPKISLEGNGIKRGLTAVEAAILMEQPMDKVLSMILFSVVKKGAAQVTSRDPLKIVNTPQRDSIELYGYEDGFLQAMTVDEPRTQRNRLQDMMIKLVKSVSEKMRGFSRKDTVEYYQSIIEQAWQQVQAADTPEVKMQRFDENMDWTMLDRRYDDRTRETFGSGPVIVPMWWGRYDPTFSSARPATSAASGPSVPTQVGQAPGRSSMPSLPGADFAASVAGGIQSFSSGVIGDLTSFTSGVTNKTNPVPPPSRSGGSRGGFGGGGGGHSCACACACAGCACACAGGGR